MVVPLIISSLGRAQAIEIARRYGYAALLFLLDLLNRRRENRAWSQQERTFREMQEAIPRLLSDIQARDIRMVPQAFNSTTIFQAYFQTAALATIPLVLLDVASAIKRVGTSLDAIRSELAISNVAKVQGWGTGGFGEHVHRFVENEMAAVDGTDGQHHFLYVWHPDSDWYPAFEREQAINPLGPSFGGYHHDLQTICLRMRADREALVATTDYGHVAVFHLLIPSYYPLVLDSPIAFAQELLPLVVTGSRHRTTDLVWFNLQQRLGAERLHLKFIGKLLPAKVSHTVQKAGFGGFMGCWFGAAGCAIAGIACPPLAPVTANIGASFCAAGMASHLVGSAGLIYEECTKETTQVLGDALFLDAN